MNKFLKIALQEAKEGMFSGEGGPFGAVIVKDGKVISKSHNTVLKDNDPTCHAEINAIRIASKELESYDLSGCELFTTCEPCPMCLGAALWARIDRIYYSLDRIDASSIGFDDEKFYEVIKSSKDYLVQIENGQLETLFKEWNDKTDKKMY
jgi:tRNA(Arg) A34 adenosine deaminase TadA